ncbi:MAG: serine/threonine-protein kinase [Chthoniobacter sp.]
MPLPAAQAAVRRLLPDELLAQKRYAIGTQVARGGMGAIMQARQQATQRDVAMKVMLESQNEDGVLRFIDEAQVTAQLEHPNIVPIYELGVDEQDQLFYTMKFVRGITLKKVLDLLEQGVPETTKKYPLSALLTIFQKTCDALAFAHARGVIHRDLKPENLMLGDFGEVLVMDWGLAKKLNAKSRPPSAARPESDTQSAPHPTVVSRHSAASATLPARSWARRNT